MNPNNELLTRARNEMSRAEMLFAMAISYVEGLLTLDAYALFLSSIKEPLIVLTPMEVSPRG